MLACIVVATTDGRRKRKQLLDQPQTYGFPFQRLELSLYAFNYVTCFLLAPPQFGAYASIVKLTAKLEVDQALV